MEYVQIPGVQELAAQVQFNVKPYDGQLMIPKEWTLKTGLCKIILALCNSENILPKSHVESHLYTTYFYEAWS